jgi:hypothetical protein
VKKIAFQYSNDNGATWSTALSVVCYKVDVYKITETDHKTAASLRKNETTASYINADITTGEDEFDPDLTAAAEANWLLMQNFCAAKLRRIYNNDTTNYPTFDEYDTFNSSTNTNYVNLLDMKIIKYRMDEHGANTVKVRAMELNLQTRDIQ